MSLDPPYADDLHAGVSLPPAPSMTIDAGLASLYQAVTGDGMQLPLSDPHSQAVTGRAERLANPGLALQVAIGQSTVATRRVVANLFYRRVALATQVFLGDTLTTWVTPVALTLTRPGPAGRRAKVLLDITTANQDGERVASFQRLALLPLRAQDAVGWGEDVGAAEDDRPLASFLQFLPSGWDLTALSWTHTPWDGPADDPLRDTVSSALELVRATQNLAAAHRDPRAGQGSGRLVYGGHVIGLAQASLSRLVPGIVTIIGWRSCDHRGPVFEGDILRFTIEEVDRIPVGGTTLAGFRVVARATRAEQLDGPEHEVLDWRPVVLLPATRSDVLAKG